MLELAARPNVQRMNIRSFGSSSLAITFAASILACASVACTVKTTGTGPAPAADGGSSNDDDDKGTKTGTGTKADGGTKPGTDKPSSGTATCQQIFQCALECEDTDCEDACYAKGSASGKAQVDALVACSTENACEDGDCITANCSAEYEACE